MLSAQAYTFGKKARLAISLAWVGGFVDAVGFIELAVYTSNMTGNTAMIGQRVAEGNWTNVVYVYFLVSMFLVGAMLAGLLIETARRSHQRYVYSTALGLEALLLALAVVYVTSGGRNVFVRGMLPCLAMGLQNATITRISGSVVRTTHVTGIVTDLGLEAVQFLLWLRDKTRRKRLLQRPSRMAASGLRFARITQRHPTFQRLLLLGSIWMTFVVGAGLGAFLWRAMGLTAMLFPAGFLVGLIVLERLTPLASVDAIDRAARARTFLAYGLEPELVPESIGIYELTGASSQSVGHDPLNHFAGADGTSGAHTHRTSRKRSKWVRKVRPPDLGELHYKLKPDERVIILMLADDIDLDPNALAGLHTSLHALRDRGQDLVLCVSTSELYAAVTESPLAGDLGWGNVCSDPEFAVARAIDLLGLTGRPA